MTTDDKPALLDRIATEWAGVPAQATGEADADFVARIRAALASPAPPVMRFRFHRGSLADSMSTLREFVSDLEFRHAIEDWLEPGFHRGPPDLSVLRRTRIEPYGEGSDDRIGWPATFVVMVDDTVVGFADSDGSNLPMWT